MGSHGTVTEVQVSVYTTPGCVQCDATKRALNKYGIPFSEIDLNADEEARGSLTEAGWRRAPVVETSQGEMWSGFRPDKIRALASPPTTSSEWSRSPVSRRGSALEL